MGSTETVDGNHVDDKEVLEGLFKGNKDILEFLSPGLTNNSEQRPSEGQDIPGSYFLSIIIKVNIHNANKRSIIYP